MRTTRPNHRAAGMSVTALAALVFAAGCGDGESHGTDHTGAQASPAAAGTPAASPAAGGSAPAATGDRNDADITFAQNMILHHRQAVDMAALAETRAGSEQVRTLAAAIKQAQGPEIEQMTGWLTLWGASVPSMPAGGHDSHAWMPGMMSGQEMAALKAASGADFDRRFLQMMIRHHKGALEMATTEQQQGRNAAAKALAAKIEADQTAEIGQMQGLLGGK
jgi:uncharacterized protein (DUF305 family)